MGCPKLKTENWRFVSAEPAKAPARPFRFSSEYLDSEANLVYYNYRYYSPEIGRWLSRDSIGENGGINLYVMVGNSPVGRWDHLGLLSPRQIANIINAGLRKCQNITDSCKRLCCVQGVHRTYQYWLRAQGISDDGGVAYYGTRGALYVSTAAISLAAILGISEFAFMGNESFLTIESNQTNLLRILSKPLRKGFRVDRPNFHKPFYHTHFWSW